MHTLQEKDFPTFKIRSFDDLMEVVTDENCDMVFGNFYGCVKAFLKLRTKHPDLKMLGFDWTDDGKIELTEVNVAFSQRFKIALGIDENKVQADDSITTVSVGKKLKEDEAE